MALTRRWGRSISRGESTTCRKMNLIACLQKRRRIRRDHHGAQQPRALRGNFPYRRAYRNRPRIAPEPLYFWLWGGGGGRGGVRTHHRQTPGVSHALHGVARWGARHDVVDHAGGGSGLQSATRDVRLNIRPPRAQRTPVQVQRRMVTAARAPLTPARRASKFR